VLAAVAVALTVLERPAQPAATHESERAGRQTVCEPA
jgi:hypothetical protein